MKDKKIQQGKYLEKFKNLEAHLKRTSGVSSDRTQFKDMLDKARQKSPVIKYKEGLIWDLYGLRNVFAHADREKYIAEINHFAYEAIDNLVELISNPPTVGEKFQKEVYWVSENEITEVVIQEMREKLYTHVPVYRKIEENYKFIGVFSESSVFCWLADNIREGRADFYKKQMKNINPKYLNDPNDLYKFIASNKNIFEAYDDFKVAVGKGKRLGVIFITPSSKRDEIPTGIITAWDLPEVEKYFNQ